MRKAVNIALWIIGVGLVAVLLGFANAHTESVRYEKLVVNIDNAEGNFFVSREDIEQAVQNLGYAEGETFIKEIDVRAVERYFDNYPSIRKSEVYVSYAGQLNVDIEQRMPIVRVFASNGDSYYIDDEGYLMPLSDAFTSRVMVSNGLIHAPYGQWYNACLSCEENETVSAERDVLRDVYFIARAVSKNPFWKAQIAQVYLNAQDDFELIPKVGKHRIILGSANRIEQKLEKLSAFYNRGLSKTGWNEYETINLKFDNQVVCTKK